MTWFRLMIILGASSILIWFRLYFNIVFLCHSKFSVDYKLNIINQE